MIEEIKDRVNQRNEHYVYESEYEVQYHHDIVYLLSIIEQAEKALQQAKEWTDNRSEAYGMNANMIATEALKAIREG